MSKPKKRTTKTVKGQRRSHLALKAKQAVTCENCKKAMIPHRVCQQCGMHKGKQVVDVAKRVTRRAKHLKPIT